MSKRACKGDDNDVTCKDDRRPSLKIIVKQENDELVLDVQKLVVDHGIIPHFIPEIFNMRDHVPLQLLLNLIAAQEGEERFASMTPLPGAPQGDQT